jgi:hypothetical protein
MSIPQNAYANTRLNGNGEILVAKELDSAESQT